jgi:hypothetical protein
MVSLFIIDVMHTFDYGALQTYFTLLWAGLHSTRTAKGRQFREDVKAYTTCNFRATNFRFTSIQH